jgi:hypothetical protein
VKITLVGLSVGLGMAAFALAVNGHTEAALLVLFFAVAVLPVNDSFLIAAITIETLSDD